MPELRIGDFGLSRGLPDLYQLWCFPLRMMFFE